MFSYLCSQNDGKQRYFWFKTRVSDGKQQVFDPLRRLYVALTPEERVRQAVLRHLVEILHYPAGRIAVEYSVCVNGNPQRADIVVFNSDMTPFLIVECKAASVQLTPKVLDQALRYHSALKASNILLTNGKTAFCYAIDHQTGNITALGEIPPYPNN